jgi:hypothetical protein
VLDQWDMGAIFRDAAKAFRWVPDQVWSLTPFELVAIFGKQPGEGERESKLNKLAILAQSNLLRAAKGLRPVVPSWWGKPAKDKTKGKRRG